MKAFVVNYWYLIVIVALSAIIAGFTFYVDMLQTDKKLLESEKRELITRLDVSQNSVKELQQSINDQNAAIRKLQQEGELRQQQAEKEIAAAKKQKLDAEQRAKKLMTRKLPAGKDVCTAADELINEEIRNAR